MCGAPTPGMTPLIPIVHRGRTVGAASRTRFFLADHLQDRPAGDADRTWAIYMCAYAGDVLNGRLPGPYSDDDARQYARACLIPDELLERAELDVARVAGGLGVPVDELALAQRDTASADDEGGNAPR